MRVGLSSVFRHFPSDEEDGPTLIQASTVQVRPDMDEWEKHSSPECPPIFPRLGFLAGWNGHHMRWSFIRFEPPQQWSQDSGFKSRNANLGTTAVGKVSCSCGWSGYYPIKPQEGSMACPWCGKPGASVSQVRIPSDEFDGMLGDLRDPLEQAAKAAFDDPGDSEFNFPQVLIGGPAIEPSGTVPPNIQGKAQEKGVGLRPLAEIPGWKDLRKYPRGSIFLGIVPGVTSGKMDDAELAAGKAWEQGCVRYWTKLKFPQPCCVQFGTCKF